MGSITTEANAPASTSTGAETAKKSGNISEGQAINLLMAMAKKEIELKPAEKAPENVAPVVPTTETTSAPAAETSNVSETTPAETPPVETTETPAATEVGADTVPSQSNSFTPEQQDIFNKRIQREVAKTKAIQAEFEDTKARLAELEARTPVHAPVSEPVVIQSNQPLPNINDVSALAQFESTAKEAKRYATRVLEDPTQWKMVQVPSADGRDTQEVKVHYVGNQAVTEQQMRSAKWDAEVALEDHIPEKRAFLTDRTKFSQMAESSFPFLKDRSSPEYQMVQAARRDPANAAIMASPNADWILGVQIKGLMAIKAEEALAKAKVTAAPVKPKVVHKPSPDQTAVSASTAEARAPAGSKEAARKVQALANLKAKGNISPADASKFLQQKFS